MNVEDCALQTESTRFRYRAGAIIVEDECVLMAKNDRDPYFYSVGGAVRLGECAEEAAQREAHEETGIRYAVDRLLFIHENFFVEDGVRCHEITLYFLMKPTGIKSFRAAPPTQEAGEERMVWVPISDYGGFRAYPEFFGEKLRNLAPHVEHIVTGAPSGA